MTFFAARAATLITQSDSSIKKDEGYCYVVVFHTGANSSGRIKVSFAKTQPVPYEDYLHSVVAGGSHKSNVQVHVGRPEQ